MVKKARFAPLTFILGCILLVAFTACKDSGSVGNDIGQAGVALKVDTLAISGVHLKKLNAYSGGFQYISAGRLSDPLFGDISTIGYIKPSLAANSDTTMFDGNTTMHLRLAIHQSSVYGDTLKPEKYTIKEIDELFRAPSSRLKHVLRLKQGATVGSFSVSSGDDTLNVPLSKAWVQKYGQYFNKTDSTRNSVYVHHFYGLALVPENKEKIVTFDAANSRFIAKNIDTQANDSLSILPRDYAFSLQRSNIASGNESTSIFNTLEHVLTFNFNFSSDNIDPINVAKAEIVIKRDNLLLKQIPNGFVRPKMGTLGLHYIRGDELPQSLQPGSPIAVSSYDKKDDSYHFNITSLVKQRVFDSVDSTRSFYIAVGMPYANQSTGSVSLRTNTGIIRSTLLFINQTGAEGPKLIISSVKSR